MKAAISILQRLMRREVAADQMRGAAAGTPLHCPIGHSLGDFGVAGQAEVIIAGKIEQVFAVDRSNSPAGRFQHAAAAGQAERAIGGEFGVQALINHRVQPIFES
jgi:hypothetical protein